MIGQPKNYSEMLKRIFWVTLIVGLICTITLGYKSPEIKKAFTLLPIEVNIGGFEKLPLIYAVIPLFIAILTRWITLHDRISDIFHIRERFDINHILLKLAEGVAFKVNKNIKKKLNINRHNLMRHTFYKYTENVDKAVINSQLVANALDSWGWFWCFLEPLAILFLSALIAWYFISIQYALWYFFFLILFIILAFATYPICKKAAKDEVADILNNANRRKKIREIFNAL